MPVSRSTGRQIISDRPAPRMHGVPGAARGCGPLSNRGCYLSNTIRFVSACSPAFMWQR